MYEDDENRGYYALQATSDRHAAALAAKSRRAFGEGYKRGDYVIIGPTDKKPWAFREALPSAGNWNMYFGRTPADAAEAADIDF